MNLCSIFAFMSDLRIRKRNSSGASTVCRVTSFSTVEESVIAWFTPSCDLFVRKVYIHLPTSPGTAMFRILSATARWLHSSKDFAKSVYITLRFCLFSGSDEAIE